MTSTTQSVGGVDPQGRRMTRLVFLVAIVAAAALSIQFLATNPGPYLKSAKEAATRATQSISTLFGDSAGQEHKAARTKLGVVPLSDVKILSACAEDLDRQVQKSSADPALQNRLGLLYAQLGEFPLAILHLHSAVQLGRVQVAGALEKSKECQQNGDIKGAIAAMDICSQLHVELSAAHSNLARIYDKLGQQAKVVAELDELNSDITFAQDFSKTQAANKNSADDDVAALIAAPHPSQKLTGDAATSLARAQALMHARRIPEAVDEYKRLITAHPELAVAHHELGLCSILMGNEHLASTEFETAVQLSGTDANFHNDYGMALLNQGDADKARGEFLKALALDPKHLDAAINLANMYASHDDYPQAEQLLSRAVVNNPHSSVAHNNLATVLSLSGKPHEAIKEFETSLTINEGNASSHYGLGLALLDLRQYQGAIHEFQRALQLNPALADAHSKIELAFRRSEQASAGGAGQN